MLATKWLTGNLLCETDSVGHRSAAETTEAPTDDTLHAMATAWRLMRQLQIVGTGRNLLNESYHSSAGPRWVYAPGRRGSVTVVVRF